MAYVHSGPALYLTSDRSRVVEEGDAEAAFLLVAEGGSLPDEDVKRYGLDKPKAKAAPPEVEEKAVEPPTQNKAKGGPPNKSKG